LATDATDKDDIQDRISALEYRYEVGLKQTKIMDDLSGYWVSDLVATKSNNINYVVLYVEEIEKTGNYRVTLLPESGMYQETIIDKTITTSFGRDNTFHILYANAQVHNPSSAFYDVLRAAVSTAPNHAVQNFGNATVEAFQEKDLPSNTKIVYDFQLKYVNGKLTGLLNMKQMHTAQSTAGDIQSNQDQLYKINFTKEHDYANFKNITVLKKNLQWDIPADFKNDLKVNYPDLWKEYHSASNKFNTGAGIGAPLFILGGLAALCPLMTGRSATDSMSQFINRNRTVMLVGGGIAFAGGTTVKLIMI